MSLFPIMLLLLHMYNLHTDHFCVCTFFLFFLFFDFFVVAQGSAVKLLAIQGHISHSQHPRVAASN